MPEPSAVGSMRARAAGFSREDHAPSTVANDMSTTSGWASRSYWPAKGFAALFDYAAGSHRRAAAVLVLVSLLAFLPGFFQIPPVDRDEAYFAQATKQMIETGDYVDIRYQDDVRYRKPVGIYWLQAAAVKAASALGLANAGHDHLALPHAVAVRSDRRRFGHLLVRARLRQPARRDFGRFDDGGVDDPWRRGAPGQDRCRAAVDRGGRHERAGARLSRAASRRCAAGMATACGILDGARRRHSDQGAAHSDGRRARRGRGLDRRSLRALAYGAAPAARHCLAVRAGLAVVHRHLCARRQPVSGRFGRRGHARQGRQLASKPMARRPGSTSFCSSPPSFPLRCWRASRRRRCGRCAASRRRASCWPGWCRRGSCSNWW